MVDGESFRLPARFRGVLVSPTASHQECRPLEGQAQAIGTGGHEKLMAHRYNRELNLNAYGQVTRMRLALFTIVL